MKKKSFVSIDRLSYDALNKLKGSKKMDKFLQRTLCEKRVKLGDVQLFNDIVILEVKRD